MSRNVRPRRALFTYTPPVDYLNKGIYIHIDHIDEHLRMRPNPVLGHLPENVSLMEQVGPHPDDSARGVSSHGFWDTPGVYALEPDFVFAVGTQIMW